MIHLELVIKTIWSQIWSHFNSLEKIYEIYNLKGGPIFGGLTKYALYIKIE